MSHFQPPNPQDRAHIDPIRQHRQAIAQGTIQTISNGYFKLGDAAFNLSQSLESAEHDTKYFRPDSKRLSCWRQGPPPAITAERRDHHSKILVDIQKKSTLQGARHMFQTFPTSKIGVLNFASATKPGGGFINGASAQEESIARSSTLSRSLQTPQARPFYELHNLDHKGGYYSHAMIYSPSVAIFRDDDGGFLPPYHVEVVTSPAVNAKLVRKPKVSDSTRAETEDRILRVMKERMGRILALFELRGIRNLVLGSFGTGVFQNEVGPLARIWGELLGGRFAHSFDKVMFAIPDDYTRRKFQKEFFAASNPSRTWFRVLM